MREWLLELRTGKGLTQKQMADKLDISEAYYSYIEKGERQKNMDISLVSKLSTIFGIPVQKIVDLENGAA